ncbi:DnaJ domain-containing protein [Cardiosporidium cionae]|uniref:DnaJ domain-containing protein n=1 Tax=Cardiosporidium cionae TaxID=476202 RepID=A0ABQ7JCR2_9APIC|nr:DnaJ domain-containing protein [Cardiosporidium cionae]|eukprot:KAF8821769.1 DnaJ domain-containing protein [Cardiosporidium cionae]
MHKQSWQARRPSEGFQPSMQTSAQNRFMASQMNQQEAEELFRSIFGSLHIFDILRHPSFQNKSNGRNDLAGNFMGDSVIDDLLEKLSSGSNIVGTFTHSSIISKNGQLVEQTTTTIRYSDGTKVERMDEKVIGNVAKDNQPFENFSQRVFYQSHSFDQKSHFNHTGFPHTSLWEENNTHQSKPATATSRKRESGDFAFSRVSAPRKNAPFSSILSQLSHFFERIWNIEVVQYMRIILSRILRSVSYAILSRLLRKTLHHLIRLWSTGK